MYVTITHFASVNVGLAGTNKNNRIIGMLGRIIGENFKNSGIE